MKPTYRNHGWESSDVDRFDLGPLLRGQVMVQGFGELSFRWIQICIGFPIQISSFYPIALKSCRGIVFTHGVQMVGQWEKGFSGLYLRNRKV